MLSSIFPKQIDNNYRGYTIAIVIFAVVMLGKGIQGVESVVNSRNVMTTADGIPLGSLGAGAADLAVAMFALLGLYVLILPMLSLIVLVRYRAMIPLVFLLFLLLQAGARVLSALHPIARSPGTPIGFTVSLIILIMAVIGFALSLQRQDVAAASA